MFYAAPRRPLCQQSVARLPTHSAAFDSISSTELISKTMELLPQAISSSTKSTNMLSAQSTPDDESVSKSEPGRILTPPPPLNQSQLESKYGHGSGHARRARNRMSAQDEPQVTGLDPSAVESALLRELQRPHRESTPSASPHRKRQRINGDR